MRDSIRHEWRGTASSLRMCKGGAHDTCAPSPTSAATEATMDGDRFDGRLATRERHAARRHREPRGGEETHRPFAGDERAPARLEGFSDAVMAIAITLLVLDVPVPPHEALKGRTLWRALAQDWPSYLGYGLSFLVIGLIWANHHAIFKHILRVDHSLVILNLSALFVIGVFPFATALLAEYLTHAEERIAVLIYAGCYLAAALAFYGMWSHARQGCLLDPATDQAAVMQITQRFRLGPPCYAIAIGAAIVSAPASLAILAGISLFYYLPPAVQARAIRVIAVRIRGSGDRPPG